MVQKLATHMLQFEGINNYSGKLTLKYTISKADLANATSESSMMTKQKRIIMTSLMTDLLRNQILQ